MRSHIGMWVIILLLMVSLHAGPAVNLSNEEMDLIQNRIRSRIELLQLHGELILGNSRLHAEKTLPLYYEKQGYVPVWYTGNHISVQADSLLKVIRSSVHEGLRPSDYHLTELQKLISRIRSDKKLAVNDAVTLIADLDLLLSDAFFILGTHLIGGRINPETLDPEWTAFQRRADLSALLNNAMQYHTVAASLRSLLPAHEDYFKLRSALKHYIKMESTNNRLEPIEESVLPGESSARNSLIRKRLILHNAFPRSGTDTSAAVLAGALQQFQQRNGLKVTGTADPETVALLNTPLTHWIETIRINMERWRWLPEKFPSPYIMVNIANFELEVVDNGSEVLRMRVVVGKDYRKTPVFSDLISYVVINPYWNVPNNLAAQDILPKIKADKKYLKSQGIRVYESWKPNARELNPDSINWSSIKISNFAFRLRQDPGPTNALGRVKFMFPNKYNVYLHDTPTRELFKEQVRTFSSGCIRVEHSMELLKYLVRNSSLNIDTILKTNKEFTQTIKPGVPVHIIYLTAWTDNAGQLQFRKDIYGRDQLLAKALSGQNN